METRRCAACGEAFRPRSQVPNQSYCPAPACQRVRKRDWQKTQRKIDPDYHDNQARAQLAWRERNPDYWRKYREEHPDYCERNRLQQLERKERQRRPLFANIDASTRVFHVPSGIYRIRQVPAAEIAKMDAWTVEITLLSVSYD